MPSGACFRAYVMKAITNLPVYFPISYKNLQYRSLLAVKSCSCEMSLVTNVKKVLAQQSVICVMTQTHDTDKI